MGTCVFLPILIVFWIKSGLLTAQAEEPFTAACMVPADKSGTEPDGAIVPMKMLQDICSDFLLSLEVEVQSDGPYFKNPEIFAQIMAQMREDSKLHISLSLSQWKDLLASSSDSSSFITHFTLFLAEQGFSGFNIIFDSIFDIQTFATQLQKLKSAMLAENLLLSATLPISSYIINMATLDKLFDAYYILPVTHVFHDVGFSQALLLNTVENLIHKSVSANKIFAGIPPAIFANPDPSSVSSLVDFADTCKRRELDTRSPKVTPGGFVQWQSPTSRWTANIQSEHSLKEILDKLRSFRLAGILIPNLTAPRDNVICINYVKFFINSLIKIITPKNKGRAKRSNYEDRFTVIGAYDNDSFLQFSNPRSSQQKPFLRDHGDTIIVEHPGEFREWIPDLNVNDNLHIPYVTYELEEDHKGAVLDADGRVILDGDFMKDLVQYVENRHKTDDMEVGMAAFPVDTKIRPNVMVFSKGSDSPLPVPMLLTWKAPERAVACNHPSCSTPFSLLKKPVRPAKVPTTCTAEQIIVTTTRTTPVATTTTSAVKTTMETTTARTPSKKTRKPRPTTKRRRTTICPTTKRRGCPACERREQKVRTTKRLRPRRLKTTTKKSSRI